MYKPNYPKSFRYTQTKLDRLTSEYETYGFKQNDIRLAWQQSQENENKFHDILITLVNQNDFVKKEQLQSKIKIKNQNNEMRLFQSKLRMKSNEELQNFEAQTLLDQLRDDNENYSSRVPTGLMNLGNTCYLNIMLQFIYNIIPFRQLIFKINLESSKDGDFNGRRLIQQIKELFALMQSSNRKFINPKEFIETLEEITFNTGFQLSEQNDYSEILILFFDEVEKAISNLNNEQTSSEFYSLFQGKSEENLIVNNQVIKQTETSFQSISLDLTENNLQKAFYQSRQLFISDYEGPDGKKQQAIIYQNIKEVPKILQFYLNRVQYEQNSNSFIKSNQQFHFDSSIDINQLIFQNSALQSKDMKDLLYQEQQILDGLKNCGDENLDQQFNFLINFFKTSNQEKQFLEINPSLLSFQGMNLQLQQYSQVIARKRKQLKQLYEQIQIEKQKLMEFKKNLYHLSTVLMHSGDANHGHYYCYILCGNNWWKFNDRIVSKVDYPTVYKDATGQIDKNQNVSGLIYVHQEILQMENQISLPDDLETFVNKKNEELLTKMDYQFLLTRKNVIAQKALESKPQQQYTNIIQTFFKYQKFTEFLKNHPNKIYYLRNKMIDQDLNYCQIQLRLPHNLQKYKEFMRKQSGLLPNDYENLYKKEENQFQLGNNILANCQLVPQININNLFNVLTQFTKLCQQFYGIDESIYKCCQLFLQSILLMGCFFCDVLIQKNRLKEAKDMIYLLHDINKKSTHITPLITQQIHQNLKYAIEQLEQLKPKFDAQIAIQQPSIVTPDIQLPASKLQPIDLNEFLKRIQQLEKNIEIWSNFVVQITISQNIMPQQKRLDIEMPLYFNEKLF